MCACPRLRPFSNNGTALNCATTALIGNNLPRHADRVTRKRRRLANRGRDTRSSASRAPAATRPHGPSVAGLAALCAARRSSVRVCRTAQVMRCPVASKAPTLDRSHAAVARVRHAASCCACAAWSRWRLHARKGRRQRASPSRRAARSDTRRALLVRRTADRHALKDPATSTMRAPFPARSGTMPRLRRVERLAEQVQRSRQGLCAANATIQFEQRLTTISIPLDALGMQLRQRLHASAAASSLS